MSMQVLKQRWQPPMGLAAAMVGLIVGLAIAIPHNYSGLLLLGILLLSIFAILEPINAVILSLIIAPLKALIVSEAPAVIPGDIGQFSLILVGVFWLINVSVRRKALKLEFSWVQVPLLIFILTIVLSFPNALSLSSTLTETLKWIEMGVLISVCLVIFGQQNIQWLAFALVLAGVVQAITGLYQFFGGSGAEHLRILDAFHFRAFGTFGQPNPFGAFMGIILPIAVTSTLGYGTAAWKALFKEHSPSTLPRNNGTLSTYLIGTIFYFAASSLIGSALMASWSRGAWMGFAGALVVMLFFIPKSLPRRSGLVVLLVTLVVFAWIQELVPAAISTRMVGFINDLTSVTDVRGAYVTDENYAVTERIAHWQAAEWMARDNPWTGVGFDNYEVAYSTYALMEWQNPLGHAHNYYLNLLAEIGIIGLLAYLFTWLSIALITVYVSVRSTGIERMWSIGLLGTWTYIAIHSLVDKVYVNNIFIHIGCMFGLLAILLANAGETAK